MGAPWAPRPLLWAVLLLGWWPEGLLAVSPHRPCGTPNISQSRLSVPEGGTVRLNCSFPCEPGNLHLNWYRLEPGNQTKLASFPRDASPLDPHFNISQLPNRPTFLISLEGARRNHSGVYLCGFIHLSPRVMGVTESPRIELTVTERVEATPAEHPSPSPTPRPAGHSQALVAGVSSVLGAVLVLVLAWVLVAVLPAAPRGICVTRRQDSAQEAPPSPGMNTVDYGQLDFEWREKTPEPPTPCAPEPTEYATIVFPGPSSLSRGSAGAPGPSPEDGQCSLDGRRSWPL
ncbi:programmed cell death protein 1 isoform X3 [Erinaceus europaeus]|uniref:Programmed cell death protein 1 isoform X3 n=1 Tax=Erinaceus europaeus TaxID=9365 RepID=A0ABM3XLB2_ERIEU|nr:programmed cell death protein 1 isoform X3 [Erinaceus europaeus]